MLIRTVLAANLCKLGMVNALKITKHELIWITRQ